MAKEEDTPQPEPDNGSSEHSQEEQPGSETPDEPEPEPEPVRVESQPQKKIFGLPRDVMELHMAKRGITHIANFEPFVKLETLYLNNNRITELAGLERQVALRALHLNDNLLTTIEGPVLRRMKFLEILNLANNRLTDIESVLSVLTPLTGMRELNLKGNRFGREHRLLIIHSMPWLDILNHVPVTDLERRRARMRFDPPKASTVAFGATVNTKDTLNITVQDLTQPTREPYELLINPPQSATERHVRRLSMIATKRVQEVEAAHQPETLPEPVPASASLPVPAAMDFLSRRPREPTPPPEESAPPVLDSFRISQRSKFDINSMAEG